MKTLVINESVITQWAKKFFGHLTPECARACVLAVLKSKMAMPLAAAAFLATTFTATAQTNDNPLTPSSFVNSLGSYFTSHNLNLTNTFGAHKAELWTSVDSIQGVNGVDAKLADAVGIQYSVYDHLSLENVLRTSGIAGTIVSDQLGVGLNFVIIDTKLTLYADGGYDKARSLLPHSKFKDDIYGEVGIRVKKALTENTFAGIGMGLRLPDNGQVYQVLAGFTF